MDTQEEPNRGREGRTPRRPRSLRLFLSGWTVVVFSATLAVFTAAGILEERRQVLRNETDQAQAFLDHLAGMSGFQGPLAEANLRLAPIRDLLRAAGADLEIAPPPSRPRPPSAGPTERTESVLATRRILLREGTFELRYSLNAGRLRDMARRSAAIHLLHGVLALAALVGGTEWILRRRLTGPLRKISHQVRHIGGGGGWTPILPATDSELEGLTEAVRRLGPELERQVHHWVEAERRSAVALSLNDLRRRLEAPLRDLRALSGDLQARRLVTPEGKRTLRSLLANADRVTGAIEEQERLRFGLLEPPGAADRPDASGKETSP